MPAFAQYIHLAARVKPEPIETDNQRKERYTRLSPDEKRSLVAKWKASGMSKERFAKAHKVSHTTFHKWTKGEAIEVHWCT